MIRRQQDKAETHRLSHQKPVERIGVGPCQVARILGIKRHDRQFMKAIGTDRGGCRTVKGQLAQTGLIAISHTDAALMNTLLRGFSIASRASPFSAESCRSHQRKT
jgi:hypothetical protein